MHLPHQGYDVIKLNKLDVQVRVDGSVMISVKGYFLHVQIQFQ